MPLVMEKRIEREHEGNKMGKIQTDWGKKQAVQDPVSKGLVILSTGAIRSCFLRFLLHSCCRDSGLTPVASKIGYVKSILTELLPHLLPIGYKLLRKRLVFTYLKVPRA